MVSFARSYAREFGFVLDDMAILALYNRIGMNQTSDNQVSVMEVKELVDCAINKAKKKGLQKLFNKGRTDDFGNYMLLGKDFE